jgi:imidazolonepropionase-like amidohydrolase
MMAQMIIKNGTLIDGLGGPPVNGVAILIEDNFIRWVGSKEEMEPLAGEIRELDAGGGFILPGFIDTHVHVMLEGVNLERDMVTPFSLRFYHSVPFMRRTLEAGITSVRDAGGADSGLKLAVERGLVSGPRLQISITPLTITGGHGDGWMRSGNEFNLLPSYPGCPDGRCDGIDGVRSKVRQVLRAGAEVVKVHVTGGVLSPTDHPEFIQFSPEELEIIVREARYRRGVRVMGHAQGAEGVKNAIRAGFDSIEHGIFLDDEAIELMLAHGTYLVPTLLAPVSVLEQGQQGGMPAYGVRKAAEVVEIHRESIRRAHQAGVNIAMGTDAGVMPHGTNLRELGLMVEIGMSPMEAIVATTRTAAECMGWQDRIGTLEAGKLADIVIVRDDPLQDICSLENSDNIVLVMKDGKVEVDRRIIDG